MRTSDDMMLGQLKGLAWGKLAQTGLHSIDDWRRMVSPRGAQEDPFPPLKGAMKMRSLIAEAVDRVPLGNVREDAWFGLFDEAGMVKLVKGVSRLGRDTFFGERQSRGTWLPVRMVAEVDNIWKTDPDVTKVEPHWKLWVYGSRPLVELEWDPGDFRWKHGDKLCHFFEYSTKLGRTLQLQLDGPIRNGWRTLGIPDEVLITFWKGLWRLHMPEKIKLFWWQIGHNVIPVGEWLGKRGGPIGCPLCSSPIESLRHCLWDCPQAQKVWDRVTRLLAACEVVGTASWSAAAWIDHSTDRWTDAFNADTWCYVCTGGQIGKIRFKRDLLSASPRFLEIWRLIAGFTLWYVWKARCLKVFQDRVQPPEEVIMDIWFALISCLRGQLDEVCNHSNDVATARLRFWQKWRNTPMVTLGESGPRWNYQPPRWLFPSFTPPSLRCRPRESAHSGRH